MVDFMTWNIWRNDPGKGLYRKLGGSWDTFEWYGHSFNPAPQDQGFSSSGWAADYDDGDVYWEGYNIGSFDLTGFQSGNEVVMSVVALHCVEATAAGTYTLEIINPASTTLRSWTYNLPTVPPLFWYWAWVWGALGVRGRNNLEIDRNGAYTSKVSGTVTDTSTSTFTIANLSTANVTTYYDSGYLWVDGDNLWMTNGNGNRVKIPNDGTNYGVAGADTEGSIWVKDTNGDYHIYYVDSSGNRRRTKNGSHYEAYDNSEGLLLPSVSSSYAGYIWINSSPDDHYIYFVSNNGDIARVGVGYTGAADMQ